MNRVFSSFLVAVAFIYGIQLTACSKKSDSGTTSSGSFSIPNVTGAVATTNAQSLGLQTVSDVSGMATHTIVNGTRPTGAAAFAFDAAQNHFIISKIPDATSCLVEALVNNGLVSKDGREYVFVDNDSNQKTKIAVTASGNVPSSFKIFQCESGVQKQYVGGDLVGEDLTFNFKGTESSNKYALSVSGKYNGSTWTSKQVTINSYASSVYTSYKTTQYADAMVSQFSSSGSPSTKVFSKYALSGSTTKDYAMGAGTIKYYTSSETTGHWTDALADTGTASSYAADVTAGSYLSVLSSFTAYEISGSEVWDCQIGSATQLDGTNVTQAQAEAIGRDMQSCSSGL